MKKFTKLTVSSLLSRTSYCKFYFRKDSGHLLLKSEPTYAGRLVFLKLLATLVDYLGVQRSILRTMVGTYIKFSSLRSSITTKIFYVGRFYELSLRSFMFVCVTPLVRSFVRQLVRQLVSQLNFCFYNKTSSLRSSSPLQACKFLKYSHNQFVGLCKKEQ